MLLYRFARIFLTSYIFLAKLKARVLENAYYYFHTRKGNKRVRLADLDKIIFIAHPDDEILFFGNQLLSESGSGWLVVCITNGGNRIRSKEFISVMNYIGAEYIIWNLKDGENIIWNKRRINTMISRILGQRNNWVKVLTHNYDGEYGHYQHKQVHQAVSHVYSGSNLYFTANKHNLIRGNKLPIDIQTQKRDIFKKYYKSQAFILDYLPEYFEYEQQELSGGLYSEPVQA